LQAISPVSSQLSRKVVGMLGADGKKYVKSNGIKEDRGDPGSLLKDWGQIGKGGDRNGVSKFGANRAILLIQKPDDFGLPQHS